MMDLFRRSELHYAMMWISPMYDGNHYAVAIIFPKFSEMRYKNYYMVFDPNEDFLGKDPNYTNKKGIFNFLSNNHRQK